MSTPSATDTRADATLPSTPRPARDPQLRAESERTVRVLVGSALGVLPLLQLLTDARWLIEAWISMAIVVLPAAAMRLRWRPTVAQLGPGLVLLVLYLTRRYLPTQAWGGFIPRPSTFTDGSTLLTALRHTISDSTAPLQSNPAIRFFLSIGLVLLAVLVDILAVQLHRPALAGVPLLLVFTLAGAVPRQSVSWLWFALAGIGYLIILSAGTVDDLHSWGQVVQRREGSSRSPLTSALSGRRIALIALVIAIAAPFLVPLRSVNLLANAMHNGHQGDGGSGGGVTIDPLAVLRGELTRTDPVALFTVDVSGANGAAAFYVRSTVLEDYNGRAWVPGPTSNSEPAPSSRYETLPAAPALAADTRGFTATVTVQKLAGNAPLFAEPSDVTAIPASWRWTPRSGLLTGDVSSGERYTESVSQPNPSTAQLEAAPVIPRQAVFGSRDQAALAPDLALGPIPQAVTGLVTRIAGGKSTPYDQARALSTYFTDPANGFVYSLQTKSGESGSDLVNFLTTGKAGFCQQYAAALAVMMRIAGIPTRVVLGYTHPPADGHGHFQVTTDDAHAWVEGYFAGVGWVPFDPTPLTGANSARAVALPWAPHPQAAATEATANPHPSAAASSAGAAASAQPTTSTSAANSAARARRSREQLAIVALVALILLVAAFPWLLRVRRRTQRLARARIDGVAPLWDELADTVRDLGHGWSPARTPRQVGHWLTGILLEPRAISALQELTAAVELQRYGAPIGTNERARPDPQVVADLSKDLLVVRRALAEAAPRRRRVRARLFAPSLRLPARLSQSAPEPSRVGAER